MSEANRKSRAVKRALCVLLLFSAPLAFADVFVVDAPKPIYAEIQSVVVSALGRDEAAALNSALSLAVERVAGTMLTSEIYIKNGELIRDEITRFSSSYVKSYKIISSRKEVEFAKVTIAADVAKRKVAEKLSSVHIDTLTLADGEEAHDSLLARADEYQNRLLTIRRGFKRTFGDINSLFTVTASPIRYDYLGAYDKAAVPFEITVRVSYNRNVYEKKAGEFLALMRLLGGKTVSNYAPVTLKTSESDNKTYFRSYPFSNEEYVMLVMRHGKDNQSFIYDKVSLFDAEPEMRELALTAFAKLELADNLRKSELHIELLGEDGEALYESISPLLTNLNARRGVNSQEGLHLKWSAKDPKYNYLFPMAASDRDMYGSRPNYAQIAGAFIYQGNSGLLPMYLSVYSERERRRLFTHAVIAPFFNLHLFSDGSLIGSNNTREITLVYRGILEESLVGKVKGMAAYTKNSE